jgi:hypothetical protein
MEASATGGNRKPGARVGKFHPIRLAVSLGLTIFISGVAFDSHLVEILLGLEKNV